MINVNKYVSNLIFINANNAHTEKNYMKAQEHKNTHSNMIEKCKLCNI